EFEDQLLKESIPYRAILAARNARLSLEHGFTALRDVETEGAMYADVDVKLAVNRGEVPGPRIFASTRAMAPTGMYPIGTPNWEIELPHGVQTVDGVENARLAVRDGVNSIEHGDGLTDSLIDVMVKSNVYWVPTVTVGVHVLPRGGVWPALVGLERRAFGKALRKGVKIAMGTDVGGFPWTEIN